MQANVDLFASKPATLFPSSTVLDFFATLEPVMQVETKTLKTEPISSQTIDPFAGVQLNSFDESDLFGAFTSHTDQVSTEPAQSSIKEDSLDQKTSTESEQAQRKKDPFRVKSGIWGRYTKSWADRS